MEALDAVRLTTEAARRLLAADGTGRVHSAFARTVNLELDGLGDRGWLSLHGLGPIPAPFGIVCAAPLVASGLPGAPVRVERNAVVLDGRLRIRLDRAATSDAALPRTAPPPAVIRCLRQALPVAADGLLPVAAALLSGAPPPSTLLARAAAPALARLYAATPVGDAPEWVAASHRLLGLGPGLTPAGDDCLVGWVTGAWVHPNGRRLIEAVAVPFLASVRERTGPLSRAFLAAALAGEAADPVRRFVASPGTAELSALLALGATSGTDLLTGYLLARQALGGRPLARSWSAA